MADKAVLDVMKRHLHVSWGNGWDRLSDDLKRAVLAERVLYSFIGFDESVRITPTMLQERTELVFRHYGVSQLD